MADAGYLELEEGTSPGTPSTGLSKIYVDSSDGHLKKKDDAGAVVDYDLGGTPPVAADIANTPAGNIAATNVQAAINELDTEKAPVSHVGSGGTEHALATGSVAGFLSPSDFTKLAGVASGATANDTDANLKNRANHTGTQLAGTISDFAAAADARAAITSAPIAHVGAGGSAHAQVVAGVSDGFMLAADKTKLDALPTNASLTSSLAAKANKAGDTFTGPVLVEGDNTTTGYVNLKSQSTGAPVPPGGVNISANTDEKFTITGQSGFSAVISDQSITDNREFILPDQDCTLMADPMTTAGDLIHRNGSNVTARLPGGNEDDLLRYVGGVPTWNAENLTQDFGDGSDGDLTVSGALTLTQIPYYNILTINAGAVINTNGYPIYCKVLDLTNAPAGAIHRNGNAGATVSANTGGAAGAALSAAVLGGSGAGSAGAAGATNAGTASASPTTVNTSNGGAGGNSGASGAGGTGAAAAAGGGASVSSPTHFGRFEYQFLRGATIVSGGAGGDGGNSGGGNGASSSRGAGGGGGGAGVLVIYAAEIITGPSTPSGVITANGGNGGIQTNAPAAGDVGGAGGAGGGGGGFCYIAYVKRTGTPVAALVTSNGGNGGNGSNGLGTGIGGNGGSGGNGGYIQAYNVTDGTGTQVVGSAGSAGTAASGITGGAGGNGGVCQLTL